MTTKQVSNTQTAIRLPDSLLARIDKLAKRSSPTGVHVTRAEILRRAAFLGVEQLEAEDKKR